MIRSDSIPARRFQRAVAVSVLVIFLVIGSAGPWPAQANVLDDTLTEVSDFLTELERVVSEWVFGIADRLDRPDRSRLAAATIRRLAIEDPDALAAMGRDVGFSLQGYAVSQDSGRHLVLSFIFEEDLEADRRMALWREVLVAKENGSRPELELTRALLDASDWRQIDVGPDYRLIGIEVDVGETLSTRMSYALANNQR